jgi:hypothetical protein
MDLLYQRKLVSKAVEKATMDKPANNRRAITQRKRQNGLHIRFVFLLADVVN